jgi:hypothetical protein
LSLFMMAEWEVLGEAFCAFQTPKHSRLHDIDSPYYWVPHSMQSVYAPTNRYYNAEILGPFLFVP